MKFGFERAESAKGGHVARWAIAGALALVVACGSSSTGTGQSPLESADGGSDGGGSDAAAGDGGVTTGLPDGGGSVDTPIPTCGQCVPRAPECVDADTLRWFQVKCDTGACEYIPQDVTCDRSADPPSCQDGRCRIIYVR
ncbi:hypothetical protein AKJ09_06682 [Labilithrix luteola]|uniref:Lipoprotein n=1 Tax=Labilithrix luteola TaxID=1391654 RepID=A0A0K1Q2M4_9BACT|nr:hypothetical protein [Labilithrix luteola]AKV00019.1 hypothetical protein AKJ09_06682 [Labilithrix luteola]